ncbi:hypothetical protein M406DRAFT_106086 [Cryphonectria parasitica EP155]|uniref:HMG box domain-containing protein n=1 Tax=Cryphonectria parasitica (strain ATCC 38755 / EP155) TaxID=660469 RepID=A0A9P4Y485_CRYP1|nr:uncharacterized protein M406DRAFT_106086 [Cryphonectria parasitica EP155]KAF3766077.1 hypothetical protein M406DRAFT_106086 [Cryphonectria parasitica EP155]
MSTRSSDALARRHSVRQQQPLPPHQQQYPIFSSNPPADQRPPPPPAPEPGHLLSPVESRLTRNRARSINVDEANSSQIGEPDLQSPASGHTPPNSASLASATDLICICPTPPKVPRPRNAFILYRQHHQAGVVQKRPGLANPEISKIIGELWREEDESIKAYWKRLAGEEKARHQRQYPQYKYQPRRSGKGAHSARPTSATGEGGDPGRCAKCGGRFIATPRTPSTPFGSVPGSALGSGLPSSSGGGGGAMEALPPPPLLQHPHHRLSVDSQHGSGYARRPSSYYPHAPEPVRPIDEDYDSGVPAGMSRRRGLQQDDYDLVTSPDMKRRRFGHLDHPDEHGHGSPMTTMSQHPSPLYHPGAPTQPPHSQQQQYKQQQHPESRRSSAVSVGGGSSYPTTQPDSGSYQMTAPLPHPRPIAGSGGPQHQHHHHQQQQQQQQMAPPPRPARLNTASGMPHHPPGLPARAGQPGFDESLTLAPLQFPPSSPTQMSDTSGGARSMSGGGLLGMASGPQQQALGSRGDSQARGIEAMVMSIPYMNKLDVLRKISPPLGPPGAGSPIVETRGPVIAIEGGHEALMREVRPVIERALRISGECEVKVWTDSSVDRALTPPDDGGGSSSAKKAGHVVEDVEMAEAQDKGSHASSSRHSSIGGVSGTLTPTPRSAGAGGAAPTANLLPPHPGPTATFDYLQTIMKWHTKSAEMVKHITTRPLVPAPGGSISSSLSSSSSNKLLLPVALVADGFSLTLSDRFASTVAITDPYSPVDHWQWMATLWRGIVGADLVVYVRAMTAEELARNSGTVEYRAPGVMVVRVAGERVDEKTERRLAFEVMEWVRAGSFREGYSFGGGG